MYYSEYISGPTYSAYDNFEDINIDQIVTEDPPGINNSPKRLFLADTWQILLKIEHKV